MGYLPADRLAAPSTSTFGPMPYELHRAGRSKVAVVTGAGRMRSIGRPIAVELARAGCDIVLTGTGRSPDRYPDDEKAGRLARHRLRRRRGARRWAGGAAGRLRRVRPRRGRAARRRRSQETFGRVDIVVNNAGAARGDDRRPVVDLDLDLWRTSSTSTSPARS